MGTDIYSWIEYDRCDAEPFTTPGEVHSITRGAFDLGRDYRFFTFLAGVRAGPGEAPLIPPRGIPAVLSDFVTYKYYWKIVDKINDRPPLAPGLWASRPEAAHFVREGSSHYHPLLDLSKNWVSDPEFHHPGWLYYEELKAVIRQTNNLEGSATLRPGDLLLRVMEHISAQFEIGYDRIRFVFWFHG